MSQGLVNILGLGSPTLKEPLNHNNNNNVLLSKKQTNMIIDKVLKDSGSKM
jgi:hypothetical protein